MGTLEKVTQVLAFSGIQTVLSKILGAIQLAILIRLLTNAEMGIIGLAAGYVGVLGFIAIAPEAIFLRDFTRMKGKLNEYLTSFFLFGLARGLLVMLGGIAIAYWLMQSQSSDAGGYFLIALGAFVLNLLTGPFREAFYAQYRQARIVWVDLTITILSLILIVFVYFTPHVLVYGALQFAVALLGVLWWIFQARTHMGFRFTSFKGWFRKAWESLSSFSIWNHFTSSALRMVYQADIIILSFFIGLNDLGDYTIALTIANVFFVFPQLIQKVTSLSFSSYGVAKDIRLGLGLSFKYNLLFCLAQFGLFLVFGHLLVAFFGPENPENVLTYAFYLVLGVTIFSIFRPWVALLVVHYDPRKLFIRLFAAFGVVAFIVYYVGAVYGGAIGVAQSNVLLYALLGLIVVWFTWKELKIWPDIPLYNDAEKRLFKELLDKPYKLIFGGK